MFGYLPKTAEYLKCAYREMKGFDLEGDYRPMARLALKQIMEDQFRLEITEELGLEPYERAKDRLDFRNGSYMRHFLTELGDLELQVPRLRNRALEFKSLVGYARRSKSIDRAILGCFILGHSTRKVGVALAPILAEIPSSSTVSRIAKTLDEAVEQYHRRPLTDDWRFLFFDGVVLKRKGPLASRRRVFLCAYGIRQDGQVEIIDFHQAQGESQGAWDGFLRDLYQRGLVGRNTELVTIDGGKGLEAALEVNYHNIPRQRCWAHKTRNILNKVKKTDQDVIKRAIHKIWGAANLKEATKAYWQFAKAWRDVYPSAVACLDRDLDELLAFYHIKDSMLWPKIRTTNPIERVFREVKRRTRPMGVFTNKQSMERIVFAVFYHLNNSWNKKPFELFTHK